MKKITVILLTIFLILTIAHNMTLTFAAVSTTPFPVSWNKNLGYWVYSVAWSPDGSKIAAGTAAGKLLVFSSNGTILWEKSLHDWIYSVAWSPDSEEIAIGVAGLRGIYQHGALIVFSSNGTILWEKDLNTMIYSISWSPDGSKIAAGTAAGNIIIFSYNGETIWQATHSGSIYGVAWSPNAEKLAVGTNYGVSLYSSTGEKLWEANGFLGVGVAWSPDGSKIAVGSSNGQVIVFASGGGKLWETSCMEGTVFSVAWSPDGSKIAAGGGYGFWNSFNYYGKITILSSEGGVLWDKGGNNFRVYSVSWSPDGSKIVAGGGGFGIIVFSSHGGVLWHPTQTGSIYGVAWSPNAEKLAVGTNYGVSLYSSTGEKLWEKGLNETVYSVAWSPDGSKIAAGTATGKLLVFSSNGTILWEKDLNTMIYSISWSPDGSKIAAGTAIGITVFFLNGTKLWEQKPGGWVYSVAWSPDGSKIAVTTYQKLFVYSSSGGKQWENDYLNGFVYSVSWSPDGSKIVVGSSNGQVIVFASGGGKLWEQKFFGCVFSVSWSPDGKNIAVGMGGQRQGFYRYGSIIILSSGGGTIGKKGLNDMVYSVAWSPRGDQLAVGTGSGELTIFDTIVTTVYVSGVPGSRLVVSWASGSREFIIPGNGSITLYASPGNYTFTLEYNGTRVNRNVSITQNMVYNINFLSNVLSKPSISNTTETENDNETTIIKNITHRTIRPEILRTPIQEFWEANFNTSILRLAWSSDGDKLAVGSGWTDSDNNYHGKLVILSADGVKLWESGDLGGWVRNVAWSPDGDKLAIRVSWHTSTEHNKIVIFSSNGYKIWESSDLGYWLFSISWNPDGTDLAVSGNFGVKVFSSNGTMLWETNKTGTVYSVAWSPDGSKIATWTDYGKIVVFTTNGTMVWESWKLINEVSKGLLAWSPDGSKIAVGFDRRKLIVFSSSGDKLWEYNYLGSYPDYANHLDSLAWSPDGSKLVVAVSWTRDDYNWNSQLVVFSSEGEKLLEINFDGVLNSVAWSPSGNMLAAGGGFDRFNRVIIISSTGHKVWDSGDFGKPVNSVAWSPDGGMLAVGGWFKKLLVYTISNNITVSGVPGSRLVVSWASGSREFIIPGNGSITLYASPGNYTFTYNLPVPEYFIGPPDALTITKQVYLSNGETLDLRFPSLKEITATINVTGVPGSRLIVAWNSGYKEFVLQNNSNLTFYAYPGKYVFTIRYNGKEINKSIIAIQGKAYNVAFPLSLFETATQTTVTQTPPSTTSSPTIPPALTTQRTVTTDTTYLENKGPALPSMTVILGMIALAVSAIILVGLKNRKDKNEPSIPVLKTKVGISTGTSATSTGLSSLSSIRNIKLNGLRPINRCSGEFKTLLHTSIAPQGFDGKWTCCSLGCGGWGCAYKCTQNNRTVVFKVPRGLEALIEKGIPPTISDIIMRKVRETAVTLAKIKHPHILRLLGYSEKAPLLVYEYANMGTIEDQIAEGWKPGLKEIILLGIQLGDALRYIHSRGLVHGDVKPGNIFFRDSVVKLGDFSSIVRLVTMTTSQPLAYTPGWRAPEQVYSDLKRKALSLGVENRIDVYQLGNLLLYLLAGDFIDGEEAFDQNRVNKPLGKIEHEDLQRLLSKMLSPEPAERPSMDTVVEELIKIYNNL